MPGQRISEDDQAFLKDVGARLRAERRRQERTQSYIARQMGLTRQQIQKMEAGKQNIPLPTYLSWCDVLGVEPWELIGWR